MKNITKKRIMALLLTFILILVSVMPAWAFDDSTVYYQNLACNEINCDHEYDEFHFTSYDNEDIVLISEVRLYKDEHIFGIDDILDNIFNEGHSYVDIINLMIGSVSVTEIIPEGFGLMRSSCSFGNHRGPFNMSSTVSSTVHSGGGQQAVNGVVCMVLTISSGSCQACGAYIEETRFSHLFLCTICP